MERKTAADFDPELLILFDAYVHGAVDRRGFLDRARKFAVGGVTAAMLLDALNPKFAEAQQVKKDDRPHQGRVPGVRLAAGLRQDEGLPGAPRQRRRQAAGRGRGAREPRPQPAHRRHRPPAGARQLRGVRARRAHAARRLPGRGEDEARTLFGKLDQAKTREDMVAAAGFLKARPECTGRIGAVGFCYGGGIANMLATRMPDLGGAVPFYGSAPTAEDAARIKAPLLIHYAGTDERINAMWPAYEAALKAANVKYTMHMYPGTQHGFNNDTTPRYDEAAAKLAWQRTIEFFNTNLRK